jgi:hypothetical protein
MDADRGPIISAHLDFIPSKTQGIIDP